MKDDADPRVQRTVRFCMKNPNLTVAQGMLLTKFDDDKQKSRKLREKASRRIRELRKTEGSCMGVVPWIGGAKGCVGVLDGRAAVRPMTQQSTH